MTVLITSLLFVVLVEMGENAVTRYVFSNEVPLTDIICSVFAATLLNHLLAVLIGTFMTTLVPLSWIQIAESLPQILLAANLVLSDNHRFWRTPDTPYYQWNFWAADPQKQISRGSILDMLHS